jgi:hypothetical protein
VDLSRPRAESEPGRTDWDELAKDPRYTESRDDLLAIYDLARLGQLNDESIRDLTPGQLVFLASHESAEARFEHHMNRARARLDSMPDRDTEEYRLEVKRLDDLAGQKNKLEQNACRARLEIDRRRERNTRLWTTGAVLAAACIGALGGVLGALVASQ